VALSADIVRRYILTGSGGASDADVMGFMALCKARGLNPLARDAYLVKYGDGPASTIVSKDYYVRTATKKETFRGFRAGVVVVTRNGDMEYREGSLVGGQTERLVGGWAEVHDARWEMPVKAVVGIDEYGTGKSMWKTKPATMIRKVALVQALREAYPGEFAGLYDAAEMGDRGTPIIEIAPQDVEPVRVGDEEDAADDGREE
jgi:phage recombination protein Bet